MTRCSHARPRPSWRGSLGCACSSYASSLPTQGRLPSPPTYIIGRSEANACHLSAPRLNPRSAPSPRLGVQADKPLSLPPPIRDSVPMLATVLSRGLRLGYTTPFGISQRLPVLATTKATLALPVADFRSTASTARRSDTFGLRFFRVAPPFLSYRVP